MKKLEAYLFSGSFKKATKTVQTEVVFQEDSKSCSNKDRFVSETAKATRKTKGVLFFTEKATRKTKGVLFFTEKAARKTKSVLFFNAKAARKTKSVLFFNAKAAVFVSPYKKRVAKAAWKENVFVFAVQKELL